MQVWSSVSAPEKIFQGGVVTIGNFDGLHFGHQALLQQAQACGGPVVLLTFDPHPMQVLQPERKLVRIFPRADLAEQLPKFGVDLLVILPFTRKLAQTDADQFLAQCVFDPFHPKHIVAGHDFAFGHAREGNLKFLTERAATRNARVHVVSPLEMDGEVVSSRRIRELISEGEMEAAAARLGRNFYLRGRVGTGAGRGQTIGVPTMNFHPVNEIVPANGVYATFTHWQGQRLSSVTNIGVNPTFGAHEGLKIETHVIDQTLNARDVVVDVEFVARLRPEMKFAGVEDLKKQIKHDILKANEILDVVKPHK